MFVNICLYFVLLYFSICNIKTIRFYNGLLIYHDIAKKGFKFAPDFLPKMENIEKNRNKKSSIFTSFLKGIIFFIPIINDIFLLTELLISKNRLKKTPEFTDLLIPLTDDEKENYNRLSFYNRYIYSYYLSTYNMENKKYLASKLDSQSLLIDYCTLNINSHSIPLKYDIEEVKKLSEAAGKSYSIGTVHGKYVAIIGIPNINISSLVFTLHEYKGKNDYEPIDYEDLNGKKFDVYYYPGNWEDNELLKQTQESIKEYRELINKQVSYQPSYPSEIKRIEKEKTLSYSIK